MEKKIGLAPVIGDDARILILGSLPGDESLRKQEYYGNPKNMFWKVIGNVLEEQVPFSYPEKVAYLEKHGIALWDVLKSAQREGSLDSNIQNEEFNDHEGFLLEHPSISVIALNGGKAEKSFSKYLRRHPALRGKRIVPCKSTSMMSLCAGWTLDSLSEQWNEILK